jgi:glycosyltransferase involved in cell wall biosynthesis
MSLEDKQIRTSYLKRNITRIKKLRQICKKEKVDILVSFMGEPNFRAMLATIGLPVKNIISVRTDPKVEYKGLVRGILGKYLLPCADGAVFQTKEARDWFPKRLRKRSAVIYNVVDERFFATPYKSGRDIVTCGRISSEKNHELLLRAFSRIHDKFPETRLHIYGRTQEENEFSKLKELIKKLDLEDGAFLEGECENIPEILSVAGLFVLTSNYEGLPNALMEAMAVGVPSISTDCPCGGPRELFGEELKEYLTPVGDEQALAAKMEKLLSDEEERLATGRKMKERAKAFRTEKIGKQWIAYAERVANKGNDKK